MEGSSLLYPLSYEGKFNYAVQLRQGTMEQGVTEATPFRDSGNLAAGLDSIDHPLANLLVELLDVGQVA